MHDAGRKGGGTRVAGIWKLGPHGSTCSWVGLSPGGRSGTERAVALTHLSASDHGGLPTPKTHPGATQSNRGAVRVSEFWKIQYIRPLLGVASYVPGHHKNCGYSLYHGVL